MSPSRPLERLIRMDFFLVHYFSEIKDDFSGDYRPHNVVAQEIVKLAGNVRHDIGQRRFSAGLFRPHPSKII